MPPPNRAGDFDELDTETLLRWEKFPDVDDRVWFAGHIGMRLEEIRQDYTRLFMEYREENLQPAGVVHGGAIAALIDSVVVPAIGSGYPPDALWSTIELHVQYLRPLATDAWSEGWVVRRGKAVAFTRAEVTDSDGQLVATGTATYAVRLPS